MTEERESEIYTKISDAMVAMAEQMREAEELLIADLADKFSFDDSMARDVVRRWYKWDTPAFPRVVDGVREQVMTLRLKTANELMLETVNINGDDL